MFLVEAALHGDVGPRIDFRVVVDLGVPIDKKKTLLESIFRSVSR